MAADIKITLNLIKKAKAGDEFALNALLERYVHRVLKIVRIRIGAKLRGRMESMDVVQQVMMRVIKSFKNFSVQNEGAFLHWISKLVQNEIRDLADHHNASKRNAEKEIRPARGESEDRSVIAEIPADSIWRPSFQIKMKEDILLLEAGMDILSEEEKEVIVMRQYEELSFKEIGAKLDCSEDAARMKFVRAMDTLTDVLVKMRQETNG